MHIKQTWLLQIEKLSGQAGAASLITGLISSQNPFLCPGQTNTNKLWTEDGPLLSYVPQRHGNTRVAGQLLQGVGQRVIKLACFTWCLAEYEHKQQAWFCSSLLGYPVVLPAGVSSGFQLWFLIYSTYQSSMDLMFCNRSSCPEVLHREQNNRGKGGEECQG